MRRALAVGLVVAGIVLLLATVGSGAVGTDQQAAATVTDRAPDYDRWTAPLWTPPGPWGEPLLFALQGGVGGTVLGYYLDQLRTNQKPANETRGATEL